MSAPPFSRLARVYDAIMDDVDYESWSAFMLAVLGARGFAGGRVLDLGCGTGNSSLPFVARGFDLVGLDASAEMLAVARAKLPSASFVQADFETFALPGRFALACSVFDALNNLRTPEAFARMAACVHAQLEPGGFFMFDANTSAGLRDLWEAGRAEGWAGAVYYRWEHRFDETTGLARVEAYCEDEAGSFTEVHLERAYDPSELRALLAGAGFVKIEVLSYPDGCPAEDDEPRVWVVARKPS